jgi:hypothetical protein
MCTKVDAYRTRDDKLFCRRDEAEKHELEVAATNLGALKVEGFLNIVRGECNADLRSDLLLIADLIRAVPR